MLSQVSVLYCHIDKCSFKFIWYKLFYYSNKRVTHRRKRTELKIQSKAYLRYAPVTTKILSYKLLMTRDTRTSIITF